MQNVHRACMAKARESYFSCLCCERPRKLILCISSEKDFQSCTAWVSRLTFQGSSLPPCMQRIFTYTTASCNIRMEVKDSSVYIVDIAFVRAVVVIYPGTHWFAKTKHVVAKAKVQKSTLLCVRES